MDFEKKIKESLQTQRIDLDSEMFLENLHEKRKAIEFRRSRIINAFSAMALLLFVGYSTFKSLQNENYNYILFLFLQYMQLHKGNMQVYYLVA